MMEGFAFATETAAGKDSDGGFTISPPVAQPLMASEIKAIKTVLKIRKDFMILPLLPFYEEIMEPRSFLPGPKHPGRVLQ